MNDATRELGGTLGVAVVIVDSAPAIGSARPPSAIAGSASQQAAD